MEGNQSSDGSSGRRYKGVRMRKCGKWIAEMRVGKKRSRLWIGTYKTAIAAARAHDTALFYLWGNSAKFNFPNFFVGKVSVELPVEEIRRMAAAVGAEVDAAELGLDGNNEVMQTESDSRAEIGARVRSILPDLNEVPAADESDGDD